VTPRPADEVLFQQAKAILRKLIQSRVPRDFFGERRAANSLSRTSPRQPARCITASRALACAGNHHRWQHRVPASRADCRRARIPGYDVTLWYGLIGPKGLPAGGRINAELGRILLPPATAEKWAVPGGGTPQSFGSCIARETAIWRETVSALNIKVE
jgi:hypothetical protein